MSAPVTRKRLTPKVIQAMKGECPIVSLTAYTTPVARLLDPHCDLLLVGIRLAWYFTAWSPRLPSRST